MLYEPRIRAMVESALEYSDGKYALEDVAQMLEAGTQTLWAGFRDGELQGVAITEVLHYPRSRRLLFFVFAGFKMHELVSEGLEPIRAHAKELGCSDFETCSRPGMTKELKRYGFEPIHAVLRLRIE